jgi:ssDNA thymidine ADP-ribosyltransferase, DarT
VKRSECRELYYIVPIANVASILERGILCKRESERLKPVSVAMEEIQTIRANKMVPGGRPIHDYANVYITARNPMLFKLSQRHAELCVLRVNTDVLDLPGVIIADGNAASQYTAFWASPAGLEKVDRDLVFATWWTDDDPFRQWEKKRIKCAEVLVPDRIEQAHILGAYVSCEETRQTLSAACPELEVAMNPLLFFRG